MPRFAALIRLDRAPGEPGDLKRLIDASPGSVARPGIETLLEGSTVAAWETRVSPDRPGSASATRGGVRVFLDGRLDNRGDLANGLGLSTKELGAIGDAELLVRGFEAWEEDLFARVVGPFAVLLTDLRTGLVRLARDPLGDRTLYFRVNGSRLAVASRPTAVLAVAGLGASPDESSIARFLAAGGPQPGRTFFEGVEEVVPGGLVRLGASQRFGVIAARLRPEAIPSAASRVELEGRLLDHLDAAVACRLDLAGANAVLMSGGLDSTAVAAAAAKVLVGTQSPPPLTISWVFRELPGIDESPWIDATNRAIGVRPVTIVGDDLWPLSGEASWPRPVDAPVQGPYWRLHERALESAREAGCTALLSGESGDQLWLGGRDWLKDLVGSRRIRSAAVGLAEALALQVRRVEARPTLRHALGRLLRSRSLRGSILRPWLTDRARELIERDEIDVQGASLDSAAERASELLAPFDLQQMRAAERDAESFGVELRRPFRDRRLVEFFLGLPARWLYRPGETKPLLRSALAGRLPREVVGRRVVTSLLSLANRGLAERAWPAVRATLERKEALWPRYVRRDWLWGPAVKALSERTDSVERVVLWNCYCLERWVDSLDGRLASIGSNE